ncbi:hypothetical protein [Cellulomonas rhizosphaerae]|uniref:hypothetical protein n=1 Tax=Cellulomonas rhizosphaerae TaxID=2293719 RepID=UPI001F428FE9|nr:hypothetical protein [Cellulomonas rhizosphaerae]
MGSSSFWDVAKGWAGFGRTPADDLADLARGVALSMVAFAYGPGPRRVTVSLAAPREVEALIGPGPHRVYRSDRPATTGGDFVLVQGTDATGADWQLGVPRVDVPVFRQALATMWPRPERRRPS